MRYAEIGRGATKIPHRISVILSTCRSPMPAGGCDHGEEEEKEEELTRQGRSRRDIARDWKSKGPARALALFIFVAGWSDPAFARLASYGGFASVRRSASARRRKRNPGTRSPRMC